LHPSKPPRPKPPRRPSPLLLFVEKLKPGQSFVCSYTRGQAITAWLRRLNFGFRQATLHTVGNQVRIWILKRPDLPEAPAAVRLLSPPRDSSFGRDILVK